MKPSTGLHSAAQWPGKRPTAIFTTVLVLGLIVLKTYAFAQSGALSILSSATDSALDVAGSALALAGLVYASRPADADHRWGHGKIEAVSALGQASIITGGGVFLLFEGFNGFLTPKVLAAHDLGIKVMLVSIVSSLMLFGIQQLALTRTGSLVFEGESLNYGTDAFLNVGTLLVLVASRYGAPTWIDPSFTCLAACVMFAMASKLFVKAFHTLLDRELPDDDRARIIECIEEHPAIRGWHDLRTRQHGHIHDISFDIELDPDLKLHEAHQVTKDLERSLVALYPYCDVMIHVDPEGWPSDERHRVQGVHI